MHHLFGHAVGFSLKWIPAPANGEFRLGHAAHGLVANGLL
jgi:hypothetical protein